jgi:hypothetical protein
VPHACHNEWHKAGADVHVRSCVVIVEPAGPAPERYADRAFAAEHRRDAERADRRSDDSAAYRE